MVQDPISTPEKPKRPAPPVGTARCTVGGTYISHKWACVFWLNLTTAAPAQADLQTLADKISTSWGSNVSPQMTTSAIMNAVMLVWTPSTGQELIASNATSRPGTNVANEMSYAGASFVINHRTGAYYRGGHSRSYLPGVSNVDVSNASTIASSRCTSVAAGWQSFVTALKTGPAGGITAVDVGTVRFQSGGVWMTPPVFVSWQSHSVRSTLGTQRGRLTE